MLWIRSTFWYFDFGSWYRQDWTEALLGRTIWSVLRLQGYS